MELIPLTPGVWALQGAVNSGLVETSDGLVVIDTGLDKQAGKHILRAADHIGKPLCAIVNTHAHADHFGGNAFLLSKRTVPVFAPQVEAAAMRRPMTEPEYLWNGAYPPSGLQNKFLLAEPTPVDIEFGPAQETVDIAGTLFHLASLPGHAHGQVGLYVNGVFFAADAYFDREITLKHGIPYMVNAHQTLDSAHKVLTVGADWYVPGHGVPTADPTEHVLTLVGRHEDGLHKVEEITKEPIYLEESITKMCEAFEVRPASLGAYVLLRTTIMAYITACADDGIIDLGVDGGRVVMHRPRQ